MPDAHDYTDRLRLTMRLAGLDPDAPADIKRLASALGTSYQAAKKALTGGTKMLSADNNVKAARSLRVDSEWLATGEGVPAGNLVWPLSHELLVACRAADQRALMRAENAARAALDMGAMLATSDEGSQSKQRRPAA